MWYWVRRIDNPNCWPDRGASRRGRTRSGGRGGRLFRVLVLVGGLLLFGAGGTGTLYGQDGGEGVVRPAGTTVNLFESLDPSSPIDALRLEYPVAWSVQAVRLLRYGTDPVPLDTTAGPEPGTMRVTIARPVQGPHELLFRVRLPEGDRTDRWRVQTLVRTGPAADSAARPSFRGLERREQAVTVEAAPPTGPNKALSLAEADAPVLLQSALLPPLGQRHSFTIEFWMRTHGLDEVVLSTWTGDESAAYPVELVVDPGGRLRFYSGRPGRHRALRSRRPVADGRWHHAAVVYDAEAARTRLVVDGRSADAMKGHLASAPGLGGVAVGGRVGQDTTGGAGPPTLFAGHLDELRIWGRPRSVAALEQGKSRPFRGEGRGDDVPAVRLGFDADETMLLQRWPDGARRVPASLSFRSSLRTLRARSEDRTVTLHWAAGRANVEAFVVERSTDGTHFAEVAALAPADVQDAARADATEYTYTDEDVPGNVVYYRIRQRHPDGRERTSGTIKMGLGREGPSTADVTLIGNFPNPFSEATTIAYEVREARPVTITVWDLTGQRIAQLTEGIKEPGYHEAAFEAEGLPSGTYFVRLASNDRTQSHRMVVLK